MHIASIGRNISHPRLYVSTIDYKELEEFLRNRPCDYLIVGGGDGAIRRVVAKLHLTQKFPTLILDPTGSFNAIAKLYRTKPLEEILETLASAKTPKTKTHPYFSISEEIFLFSAGNMGDLQHVFLSETLRFGILRHGALKYALALLFLFPLHLILTPFMLFSSSKFFFFYPLHRLLKGVGNFRCVLDGDWDIDFQNGYNFVELDGDIVLLKQSKHTLRQAGQVTIAVEKG